MAIMKHLLEIERKIGPFAFEAKKTDDNIVLQYRNLLRSLKWKKEDELRELEKALEKIEVENEKIYSKQLPKIMQAINEAKKSPSVDSLSKLQVIILEYNNNLLKTFNNMRGTAKKITGYCEEVTSDQEKIEYSKRIFEQWMERSIEVESVLNKIYRSIVADRKLLRVKRMNIPLANIFRRRAKKIFKGTIGKTKIYLEVKSGFDVKNDEVDNTKIYEEIMTVINNSINDEDISEHFQDWLISVKNKTETELEEDILDILYNTIIHALESNLKIIRASRANIYVNVLPENKMDSEGVYYVKSSATNIFLKFKLKFKYLITYLNGADRLDPNTNEYDTIVHELTHAFDWRLTTDPATEDLVREMIRKEPLPETIEVASTLSMLRSEGLAELSGSINSKMAKDIGMILFLIDEFDAHEVAKKRIIETFSEFVSSNADIKNIQEKVESLKDGGTCHNFGRYMAFVIIISKLKDRMSFYLCGNDNMREIVLEELSEGNDSLDNMIEKYGWKEIPASKIGKHFRKGSGLNFEIYKDNYPYVDQFITKLSLMTTPDFFHGYINACKDLGIDPSPITPEEFIRFDKDKEHQINKLRKKMGF